MRVFNGGTVQRLIVASLIAIGSETSVHAQVWTHHNDNLRTGANLAETQLNTSTVNVNQFGKLFSYAVDASVYAQPLYIPHQNIPGQGVRDVVYVATMNDSVYAFDANNNLPALWKVNFTNPAAGITAIPSAEIQHLPNVSGPMGILSTPVIDQSTSTMYLVARTKENGSYVQRLHALDITTGAEKFGGPVQIQAAVSGNGYDNSAGTVRFNPMTANQRGALVLSNGKLFIAWGGLDDDFDPYHGWVMAYSATTLQQLNVFITTPNGAQGGIWQSNNGAPVDSGGNVYYVSGNGTWDGQTNFGESVLKLNSNLSLVDWFTPDAFANLNAADLDLGVGGALLIPNTNLVVTGSKQGIVYLLNTGNLGHEQAGNGQIVQSFQTAPGHIHSGPVYYNSPTLGPLVYIWGERDYFKAFHFNGTRFDTTPATQSSFTAPSGMPGGILSVSANGSQPGAVIWASIPVDLDAEQAVVHGVLRAFDASDLTKELWNSLQNQGRDDVGNFGKFSPPTIANGKVYLTTFSNAVNVYGLLSSAPGFSVTATPNTRTLTPGTNGVYNVAVSALGGFTGAVNLTVSGLPPGANGTFAPTSVNGSGSSVLSVTLGANVAPGSYPLTIKGTSGSTIQAATVTLQVIGSGGSLSGAVSNPGGTLNLTALGTTDWAHWGLIAPTSFDHKAGVPQQISNYSVVGAGTVLTYNNNPSGFSWSDGVPDSSTTNSPTGVYIEGPNNGFSISAPADKTTRTLTVYTGVWVAQGKMVAHLSDGSAADYVNTSLNNPNGTTNGAYSFTYAAGSSGQNLVVTFTNTTSTGNVTLQAATLTGTATSGTTPITVTSSPVGRTMTIDGATCTSPCAFSWAQGSSHSMGVTTPQAGTGTQYVFTNWSDSGAATHSITVPVAATTYTANFTTQYFLTTTATTGGTINPASGWYNAGVVVAVSASANSGFVFNGFSGGLSGTTSPQNVILNAAATVAANFSSSSGPPAGSLSGAVSTPGGTVNLTALGTTDWAHWGLAAPASFDHKAAVPQQISNYNVVGGGAVLTYNDNPTGFSWSDGVPDSSTINTPTGVYIVGPNNGFSISAPADRTTRTLTVYTGVWMAQGKMVAHLSDGSAADYVNTSLLNPNGTTVGAYTFTYAAASSGQSLVVTFTNATSTGNVTLQSATLTTTATTGTTPITVTSSPVGRTMTVDGATCTSPCAFSWAQGSSHSIGVTTPQTGAGTQYIFANWSDSGAASHSITVPPAATTYTANFTTQYFLTTTATTGGTINPASGWYNAGAVVAVSASANSGFVFNGFSGGTLSGTTSPQNVTMNAAATVAANFSSNSGPPAGLLSGAVSTPGATVNLTALGTTDWAHWGLTAPTSFDHKAGVPQQISNYSAVGAGAVSTYNNNPNGYSWTDGVPDSLTTNSPTGVYIVGLNNGFSISAPADKTTRTLTVYAGVYAAQGRMVAHLSDGSAADYVNTSLNNPNGTTNGAYSFTYAAGSSGQSLMVTFTNTTSTGNVTLQAATLTGTATSGTTPITVTSSPVGRTLTVDGAACASPCAFSWVQGSSHSIGVTTPQVGTGTQYVFANWSDSGAASHSITVPAAATTYTANFATQYFLTTTATTGGTINPASGWYNLGAVVAVSASANSGFVFNGFSGGLSGTTSPQNVTMNGSATVGANFSSSSGPQPGSLSGALSTPGGTLNLTALGTTDWAHWGLAAPTSFDHKAGVPQQISNYNVVGGGSVLTYNNNPNGFSWSDGVPDSSTINSPTGVYIVGPNNGFSISAPADKTTRTLTVYTGVWIAQGKMVAHLSDGSAADYVDASLNNPNGTTNGAYSFTYAAGSSGQSLAVTFINTTSTGNVTLQAATLTTR